MSTISSHTQSFPSSSVANSKGVQNSVDGAKMSAGLSGLQALSGATPLSIGNPGFGSRSQGQFGLGHFLG